MMSSSTDKQYAHQYEPVYSILRLCKPGPSLLTIPQMRYWSGQVIEDLQRLCDISKGLNVEDIDEVAGWLDGMLHFRVSSLIFSQSPSEHTAVAGTGIP